MLPGHIHNSQFYELKIRGLERISWRLSLFDKKTRLILKKKKDLDSAPGYSLLHRYGIIMQYTGKLLHTTSERWEQPKRPVSWSVCHKDLTNSDG